MDCLVGLGQEDSLGTDRLVHWCGAQLQAPHRAVRELGFQPEGKAGVFISRWHHGSPAHRCELNFLLKATMSLALLHACFRANVCTHKRFTETCVEENCSLARDHGLWALT